MPQAIFDGQFLDAHFTRSFYKHVLGLPITIADMEAVDPEFYKNLTWILEVSLLAASLSASVHALMRCQHDITGVLELTFSTETDEFGKMKVTDLSTSPALLSVPVRVHSPLATHAPFRWWT